MNFDELYSLFNICNRQYTYTLTKYQENFISFIIAWINCNLAKEIFFFSIELLITFDPFLCEHIFWINRKWQIFKFKCVFNWDSFSITSIIKHSHFIWHSIDYVSFFYSLTFDLSCDKESYLVKYEIKVNNNFYFKKEKKNTLN